MILRQLVLGLVGPDSCHSEGTEKMGLFDQRALSSGPLTELKNNHCPLLSLVCDYMYSVHWVLAIPGYSD